jgi:hypothetical protein
VKTNDLDININVYLFILRCFLSVPYPHGGVPLGVGIFIEEKKLKTEQAATARSKERTG